MTASIHFKSAAVAAALAFAGIVGTPAHAAAPMAKFQAPGFYRIMLGDFEVTTLHDGTLDLPVDQLLKNPPAKTEKALARSFEKAPLETSDNAFLINTGSKLILIDSGAGTLFGPTLGKVVANLKAAGYQPEQVDEIYITHMHPDHVGGLAAGDAAVFPNAVVRIARADTEYWLSPIETDKATGDQRNFFLGAQASLAPYVKSGQLKPFSGNAELSPGIRSYASPGHTPGHETYIVESKGQKLVLLGDLVHVEAVQFDDPSVTIGFDSDGASARQQRLAAFADAAKQGYLVAAAHLPFPALGHIRANGKAYQFVPVNYTAMR